jgi:hypothetical protein
VGNGFKPQDVVAVKGVGSRFVDFSPMPRQTRVFAMDEQYFALWPGSAATARRGEFQLPNVRNDASFRHAFAAG